MKTQKIIFLSLCILLMILKQGNSQSIQINKESNEHFKSIADVVYFNGNFITMATEEKQIQFVAIASGKIIGIGKKEQMGEYIGQKTQKVNLFGKTMMPGFIDAHSHFGNTACLLAQGFSLSPPPFGKITKISQILESIKAYIVGNSIPITQTVSGFGYSDLSLAEKRHPTRYELDSVSSEHPIVIIHFSSHLAVANTKALQLIGFLDQNPLTVGIDTYPNGTLTGLCKQFAAYLLIQKFGLSLPKLTRQQLVNTANRYFSCGVTTTQDLIMNMAGAEVYRKLDSDFPIDINGYYFLLTQKNLVEIDNVLNNFPNARFRPLGGKIVFDGSIQAYTALLSQPYWVPSGSPFNPANYIYDTSRSCKTEKCGFDNYPNRTLLKTFYKSMLQRGADIHTHTNGDAAAETIINIVNDVKQQINSSPQSRIVLIHSQTITQTQLDSVKQLDMIISFFPPHIYYWGDLHYAVFLGPKRANRMNPAGSALRKGVNFTLHNDSPTVIAGIINGQNTFLKIISAAVNRKTISGRVLDDGTQKISVYDALKAITINSAWQSKEQNTKGSIEVGKKADLIILSDNPLQIAPQKIDSLQVLVTIKEGNAVFGTYQQLKMNPNK